MQINHCLYELTGIDEYILKDLPWFIRMHRLVTFAKVIQTVDIVESSKTLQNS
ncbi:hypothetical protein [Bacillus bingmayongensis]|uniref:hypothetical protein n=1 Tax=Bacillus bingmayongensis TaxID=1150157 RepID=UPI001ED9BE72|nr:hypothetical protein [Bacillus bingmayongensis]